MIQLIFFFHCNSPTLSIERHDNQEISVVFPIIAKMRFYSGGIFYAYDPITYDDIRYLPREMFVNDAEVFLNGNKMFNNDTMSSDFNYFISSFNLSSGDSIYLTIYLKNPPDTIFGVSVIPEEIKNANLDYDLNYYHIKWKNPKNNAYGYIVYELSGMPYKDGFLGKASQLSLDRASLIDTFRRDSCYIAVINYGSNFTRYRVEGEDCVGINKHFGVFSGGIVNLFLLDMKNNKLKKIY